MLTGFVILNLVVNYFVQFR